MSDCIKIENPEETDDIVVSADQDGVAFQLSSEMVAESDCARERVAVCLSSPGVDVEIPLEKETATELAEALKTMI